MTAFYKKLIPGKKKSETSTDESAQADILKQLKKIQEQLVYLERKVDQLLSKSPFKKRFNRHGRPPRDSKPQGARGPDSPRPDSFQGGENKEERDYFINKGNRNFPH